VGVDHGRLDAVVSHQLWHRPDLESGRVERIGPPPVRPTSRRQAILTRTGAGLRTDPLALSSALALRLDVIQYRADSAKQRGLFDADLARNAELVRDADAAVLV
jgi:hypothetical protein